jgi:hypothetical protein
MIWVNIAKFGKTCAYIKKPPIVIKGRFAELLLIVEQILENEKTFVIAQQRVRIP